MLNFAVTFGLALHMALLAAVALMTAKRLKVPRGDWPLIAVILVWADLVLAGHFASMFHALNQVPTYFFATLVGMGALIGLLKCCYESGPPLLAEHHFAFPEVSPKFRKALFWILGVSLGLALALTLVVVFSIYPDNADSIIYRLPRAYWYVSNGSLLHPFDAIDRRLTFYPLDGVALYVPLVLYGVSGVFHNLPSFIMWLAAIYTTYRFARAWGADRLFALFAMWLIAMTPNIMAQATSTNDEIITAAGMLMSMFMALRWLTSGKRTYFFLMATAMGLGIGTKLHVVFLMPMILVACGITAWRAYKNPVAFKKWSRAIGLRTALVSGAMFSVMAGSFLIYNYLSCGRLYFLNEFANDVFNLDAKVQGIFQNFVIYISQMTLAPISDLNFWPDVHVRGAFSAMLNKLTNPFIVPLIDQNPKLYHFGYRFVGVTIPTSVHFVEFSLWGGFVWALWPFQLSAARKQETFPLKYLFFILAATPLCWLMLWSVTTLYMEGTATYFAFYLMIASPAAVATFLRINKSTLNELRWILVAFVVLSNIIIVGNILAYSGFRSVTDIVRTAHWPYDWQLYEANVKKEIQNADTIKIDFTHEKMPYFGYMRWNPKAKYLDPYHAPQTNENYLEIIPASGMYAFGFMPLKIHGKLTTGATYLGLIRGIGREAIFAVGNGVEKRYPEESDYIILQLVLTQYNDGVKVSFVSDTPVGYNPDDNLEFHYEIKAAEQTIFTREWDKNIAFSVILDADPHVYQHFLTVSVRSAWNHKVLETKTYQLSGPGQWLPEGPEY